MWVCVCLDCRVVPARTLYPEVSLQLLTWPLCSKGLGQLAKHSETKSQKQEEKLNLPRKAVEVRCSSHKVPSPREADSGGSLFRASLVYRENYRPDRATLWDPDSIFQKYQRARQVAQLVKTTATKHDSLSSTPEHEQNKQ